MQKLSDRTTKKLKHLGVGIIYLFGSHTQGTAMAYSDLDIGVVLVDPGPLDKNQLKVFEQIYDILTDELIDSPAKKLDISFLQKANPALAMSAVKYGKVLFEISPDCRADFEEQTVKLYNDYLPIKDEFEQATLNAFK